MQREKTSGTCDVLSHNLLDTCKIKAAGDGDILNSVNSSCTNL